MNQLLALDERLLLVVNGAAGHHAVIDALMRACAQYSPVVFAVVLVAMWLSWKPRLQRGAFLAGAAALLALGIGQIIGILLPRLRPYDAVRGVHLLLPHAPDTSFPSDHATLAFAITGALWAVDRRLGLFSLVLSLWLCVARVYIGAHYPSDVLGGAVLGTVVAALLVFVARRAPLGSLLARLFAWLERFHLAAGMAVADSARQ